MNNAANAVRFAWKTRRAWWFTATTRTKERFARTSLGSFWLGLSNLLSISALGLVYGTVFRVQDFKSYVVYIGIGLVIWNTVAAALQAAPTLFRSNAGNIRNTNIHPVFYTLEEWAFQTQTFFQSFGLVVAVLTIFQPSLPLHLLTAGILPLVNLLIFIYWFPLLLCLLGAQYEDFFQLIPIALQLLFLLSPILYKKEALSTLGWTADINPLYRIVSDLRLALIEGIVRPEYALAVLLLNLLGLGCSVAYLEQRRKKLPFLV